MNRAICCGALLLTAGLLGGIAAQYGGSSTKADVAAPRVERALVQPPLTDEERAFVGNWRINLDAVVAMSDPGWVHNSVPACEGVAISVRADHTAFLVGPNGDWWFRWTVRDGTLVDADEHADSGLLAFGQEGKTAWLRVKNWNNYFGEKPLPLLRGEAVKPIDPASLAGTWRFSYSATLAAEDLKHAERERLNAVNKYDRYQSLETRLKARFPDGPPTFLFHQKRGGVDTAVLPDVNTERSTSGQCTSGTFKAFSYGTWDDVVVLFNTDGWAYIKPNTDFLRMVDGRLVWDELVFERDALSVPKQEGR